MSNFLVPPPPGLGTQNVLSSLSSMTTMSSIVSPHPTATKRALNNQQGSLLTSTKQRRKKTHLLLELSKGRSNLFWLGSMQGHYCILPWGRKMLPWTCFPPYWWSFSDQRRQQRSVMRKMRLQLNFVAGKQRLL